jgi:hypothetical protein
MKPPDLRILALADAKLLPPEVQSAFDHWRIWKARDAVANSVRKRLINAPAEALFMLQMYLERLEHAESEQIIFEGIYALASVVDVYRQYLALHSEYLILIMSGQLNPWGLLEFQRDFERPASSTLSAAKELWRLAQEHHVDVEGLLRQLPEDELLIALEAYYASHQPQSEQGTTNEPA